MATATAGNSGTAGSNFLILELLWRYWSSILEQHPSWNYNYQYNLLAIHWFSRGYIILLLNFHVQPLNLVTVITQLKTYADLVIETVLCTWANKDALIICSFDHHYHGRHLYYHICQCFTDTVLIAWRDTEVKSIQYQVKNKILRAVVS